MKGSQGKTNSRRESGGWNWNQEHRGILFTDLLPPACSAVFFIQSQTTTTPMCGTAHSELDLSLLINNQENVTIKCLSDDQMEEIFQLRVPLLKWV